MPRPQVVGPAAANFTSDGVSKGVHHAYAHPAVRRDSAVDTDPTHDSSPNVFVAGSLAIDLSCDYAIPSQSLQSGDAATMKPALHTSNPARIMQSLGGVAGNVARAAHLMGANVQLCSAIGDDLAGKTALEALHAAGMSTGGVSILPGEHRTAQYVAVNDSEKDLVMGMVDMSILESGGTGEGTLDEAFPRLWLPNLVHARPLHLSLDANWPPARLGRWLKAGKESGAYVSYEPVSVAKSTRLFSLPKSQQEQPLPVFPLAAVDLATPNIHELQAMHTHARENDFFDRSDWWSVIDAFGIPHTGARVQMALATTSSLVDQGLPQMTSQLLPFIPAICTKLGSQGVLLTQIIPAGDERLSSGEYAPYILSRCANGTEDSVGVGGVYMRLFPAVEEVAKEDVVSVNGVGDTFLGALVAGMAKQGKGARLEDHVDLAQRAAVLTLKSRESVSKGLGTMGMLV